MLADPWPDDPQADALETSYPLGEIQTSDLYETKNLNSLTAHEFGTRIRNWVEKILSNGGLNNASACMVVATPSLLNKGSINNLIELLNSIQNLTVLEVQPRANIAQLCMPQFYSFGCISVFLDAMGGELSYYETGDGVYEHLKSLHIDLSDKLLTQPSKFLETTVQTFGVLHPNEHTPSLAGVDKIMAFTSDPDKQSLLDSLCNLLNSKSNDLRRMDKGSVAAACCIQAGIFAGKVKDILMLRGLHYHLFCREIDVDGRPSNPTKIISQDTTIPTKACVSSPKISEGSSLEVYASHDPDGNDHFFSIQFLSTQQLFHQSTYSPGTIEVDIDSLGFVDAQLTTSPTPNESTPTAPSQKPEKSDVKAQNQNTETTKKHLPEWLRPAKYNPKLNYKLNLVSLAFFSIITIASVVESTKIAQLPWRKQCTDATINRSNCPSEKPNTASAIMAMLLLLAVSSHNPDENT